MAKSRVTESLTGPTSDEDLSPFAIPYGSTAQRAIGRKTMAVRKGDRPRDLSTRIDTREATISTPRQNAAQRLYDTVTRVAPGTKPALDTIEAVLGPRELYGSLIRGGRQALYGDAYAGNPDLQTEDALTLGLTGAAGPAFEGVGMAGRALGRLAPEWARAGAGAAKRWLTETGDLAARPAVSEAIPRENVFSVTPEQTPGASSEHRADILGGDLAARQRYNEAAPWTRSTDEGLPFDVMYAAQGIPQRPAEKAAGAYINSMGNLEINPVDVFQPEVGAGELAPGMRERIMATENLRGLLDAQEAMAGNRPMPSETGDALLYEMRGQPSFEQMAKTAPLTGGNMGMTATSRGGVMVPFGPIARSDVPATSEMLDKLAQVYPEARVSPVENTAGFFEPALGKWGSDWIEPTVPFSGEATMQTLSNLAAAPADVGMGLSSSPMFRDVVRSKIARDVGAPGVREDLQNTRKFFADADWQAALDLIRRGISPAAALAAVGYSTNALARPGRD